jgi:transposase
MKKLHRRPTRFKGTTVGIDLHKTFLQYSVLSIEGEETHADRAPSRPDALSGLLDRWCADDTSVQVCLEASGCFLWAYDLLVDRLGPAHVHVAAPSKVRVIADSMEKNDANDAWWLAYLLWESRLPGAFVAVGDLRELRIASRELRSVVDECGDLKRRMKSHLAQLGLGFSASAWASLKGRSQVRALVASVEPAHGVRGESIAHLWRRIEAMDEEVLHWRGRVDALSSAFDQIKVLRDSLAGVGPQTAAVVWSELGDPSRYRSAKSYAKATGLTPGYRESGGRRSSQKITRMGSAHVRWALTRAVLSCTRCTKDPGGRAVRHWLERAQKRKPKKAAIVAAARKLAEAIWRLFALGEAFDLTRAFGRPPAEVAA